MFHFVYCVRNLVDGKIYIGKHSTNNIDDGYMGSSRSLKEDIDRLGVEKFRKDILCFFDSSDEALEFEKCLVNKDFVNNPNTYNLASGGYGGIHGIYLNEDLRKEKNRRAALAMNKKTWSDPEFRKRNAEFCRKNLEKLRAQGKVKAPDWTGRKHSESSKRKIGDANSISQKGESNSQFGTVWIHHLDKKQSKKIQKSDSNSWIEQGWLLGRRIKWNH